MRGSVAARRPWPGIRFVLGSMLLLAGLFGWAAGPKAQDSEPTSQVEALLAEDSNSVVVLDLTGPIGPALARYIIRGIEDNQDARLIVLQMDTPGGLDTSMREIIQAILASDVPVATHVAPSGARAASAGAFILYASHVAAMAPGTAVGAATPVNMAGGEASPEPAPIEETPTEEAESETEAAAPAPSSATAPRTALEAKAMNDAVALVLELAEIRNRDVQFAEDMVREARSIGSSEALELGVIEFQIESLNELVAAVDGMTVSVHGSDVDINTDGVVVEREPMTWIQQVLVLITDPNIAFLLMSLGTIGIIAEFYNPGSFFPGIIGAICLVLAFYSLSVIPFSTAGLTLLIFGLVLMAAELFVVSGGILAAAGFVSFALGAFFLFDSRVPGLAIDLRVLLGTLAAFGGALALLVIYGLGALAKRVTTGPEELVGMLGRVVSWDGTSGLVFLHGETWSARSKASFDEGDQIKVKSLDGITLFVVPK